MVGAEIASDKAHEERLEAIGKAAFAANQVLDVESDRRQTWSMARSCRCRLRERIRAAGPTNRNDLGKQAHPHRACRMKKWAASARQEDEKCTATMSSTRIS